MVCLCDVAEFLNLLQLEYFLSEVICSWKIISLIICQSCVSVVLDLL